MNNFGPIYCETGHPWLFMAEPVNTISNLVIIAFGFAALAMVRRHVEHRAAGPWVLTGLLLATGFGSLAWHALRTRMALTFDVLPGLFFFTTFVFLWMRTLHGIAAAIVSILALIAVGAGMSFLFRGMPTNLGPFIPFFVSIFLVGTAFVYLTYRKHGAAIAGAGGATLLFAVTAATFRSIDLMTCETIPFGVHFLWHVFLSTAAYSGIRLLLLMRGFLGRKVAA